jgi:hypothetical protein
LRIGTLKKRATKTMKRIIKIKRGIKIIKVPDKRMESIMAKNTMKLQMIEKIKRPSLWILIIFKFLSGKGKEKQME